MISNYFNNVFSTRGNSERFQRRNPVTHRKKGRARQPNNAVRAGLNKWLITLIIRVRERALQLRGQDKENTEHLASERHSRILYTGEGLVVSVEIIKLTD